MKFVIAIVLIVGAVFGGYQIWLQWLDVREEDTFRPQVTVSPSGGELSGMPPELEPSYHAAAQRGTVAMRQWLAAHGRHVQDPRKAWIELDYAVLVAREDVAEARRVFAEVKKRTPASSPVYPRIQRLEKTYE